jgi:hypothetical protein
MKGFEHCLKIWYDFLHEAILVFRADFGAWTIFNVRRLRIEITYIT